MKRVPQLSAAEAALLVKSGAVMMVGGFGMTGTPVHLLHALAETDYKRNLSVYRQQYRRSGAGRWTAAAQWADQEGDRLLFHQQSGSGGGGAERDDRF